MEVGLPTIGTVIPRVLSLERAPLVFIPAKMMKAEFDPKDIPVRESRDSADHPSSNAIIIGLDVTGSMSDILEGVAKKLNVLVSEILDRKPVTDPQIMFNAIGDAMCDTTPFQATQFESDIRIAEPVDAALL